MGSFPSNLFEVSLQMALFPARIMALLFSRRDCCLAVDIRCCWVQFGDYAFLLVLSGLIGYHLGFAVGPTHLLYLLRSGPIPKFQKSHTTCCQNSLKSPLFHTLLAAPRSSLTCVTLGGGGAEGAAAAAGEAAGGAGGGPEEHYPGEVGEAAKTRLKWIRGTWCHRRTRKLGKREVKVGGGP